MGSVSEIAIRLPHAALANADWADAYQVNLEAGRRFDTARDAAEAIVHAFPKATNYLLALRGIIMAPFGLKGPGHIDAMKVDRVGFFPIMNEKADSITAGFDDSHLDFRIVVDLGEEGSLQTVKLATIIRRHNWVGKTYLAVILPFHRWIIQSALARLEARVKAQA